MNTSQHGTVDANKRRTEIMDLLRWKQIEFLREPSMSKANELRALRDEQSDIEANIVKYVVNRKMFDMMLEDAESSLVTADDGDVIEATDDDYGEAASAY